MQTDTGLRQAPRTGQDQGEFAQILDPRGHVFDATPGLPLRPLLSAAQLRRAQRGATSFDASGHVPGGGPVRLLATPVHAQGRDLVVVVGASLADRNQAVENLTSLLLIGGPIALLLAALAAYGVASAALRPVESMRARAATISADHLDQRLPLSQSRDELHRLGETLNEMLARVETGLARERAFAADASHELRTPLAMLRTELELMARDRPAGRQLEAAVEAAIGDADRLTHLTDDLLTLARADDNRLPLKLRTTRVNDLLASSVRGQAGSDVAIDHTPPTQCSPTARVRVDPRRLDQALTNLVANALRHGGAPVRICALERDGFVELHVIDDGPGFPPDFLAHAFERFARADVAHTKGGTGLGLAIVSAIAEMHGGSAHATNRPEGGADVWIALPITDADGARRAPLRGIQERFRAAHPKSPT
jgi:two-component system OmpR family sensor kinase